MAGSSDLYIGRIGRRLTVPRTDFFARDTRPHGGSRHFRNELDAKNHASIQRVIGCSDRAARQRGLRGPRRPAPGPEGGDRGWPRSRRSGWRDCDDLEMKLSLAEQCGDGAKQCRRLSARLIGAGSGRLRPAARRVFEALRFPTFTADARRAFVGGLRHRQGALDGAARSHGAVLRQKGDAETARLSRDELVERGAALLRRGQAHPASGRRATEESQARARRAAYRTLELAGDMVEPSSSARPAQQAPLRARSRLQPRQRRAPRDDAARTQPRAVARASRSGRYSRIRMSTEGCAGLPSQFGRYTLLERLAVGGMAEVFRAKIVSSHGFEKILVIKRILPHLAADRGFVSMFIDEAKLTAQLTHPKIVQILDFGDVAGPVLHRARVHRRLRRAGPAAHVRAEARAAAAAPGGLHHQRGARGARLRAQRARHGGEADADRPPRHLAVEHLHLEARRREAGRLRHRARARGASRRPRPARSRASTATCRPSRWSAGALDGRSDLFAVGVVLAEMLIGRRLFTAPADLDVLLDGARRAHSIGSTSTAPTSPPALDRIVRRALKKDPAERPQSGAEFRDELSDYLFESGSASDQRTCARSWGRCSDADPETAERLLQAARRADEAGPRAAAEPAASDARGGRTGGHRDHGQRRQLGRGDGGDAGRAGGGRDRLVGVGLRFAAPARARPKRPTGSWQRAGRTFVGAAASRRCRARASPAGSHARTGIRPAGHTRATSGASSPARPSARPTARATSASSRRCGCSATWRSRARPASCASRCRAPRRRSSW